MKGVSQNTQYFVVMIASLIFATSFTVVLTTYLTPENLVIVALGSGIFLAVLIFVVFGNKKKKVF